MKEIEKKETHHGIQSYLALCQLKKKNFKYLHQCFSNFFFSHDPLKKWTTCHKL